MVFFKTLLAYSNNLFLIFQIVSCNKLLETLERNSTRINKGFCLQKVIEVEDSSTAKGEQVPVSFAHK